MRLAIMQPYLFPYIGYFQLINKVETLILHDNIQYVKRSWINRNRLRNSEESADFFTLPLERSSNYHDIVKKRIHEKEFIKFKSRLINRVKNNYSKADYFIEGLEILENCLAHRSNNLFDFLHNSIVKTLDYLCIDTSILISSKISIDHSLKAQDKVIELCKASDCTEYWNVYAGYELYDFKDFNKYNIKLNFIEPSQSMFYNQRSSNFIPDLSILDVIMNNSIDQVKDLLKEYKVKKSL